MKVVVCTVPRAATPWRLPDSRFGRRHRISGGERSLYELAIALTAGGADVELRGDLVEATLRPMCDAANAEPRTGMPPRFPEADDVVIVPEGGSSIDLFATIALSASRAVILLLGPPGQYGWNFVDPLPPDPPDVLTFPIDSVGRPEHFRAMHAAGFELWSNSPGLAAAATAAGVDCVCLGTGNPEGFPNQGERTHDLAVIVDNKWTPHARRVVEALPGRTCLEIGDQHHATLAAELGRARVLVWPSRVEGDSRIQREARAMGTVPVALSSNRFAAQLDDDGGAVLVDDVAQMPDAVRRLLDDPDDLASRSARASSTSRSWADWPSYVERAHAALTALGPADVGRGARTRFGESLRARDDALTQRIRDISQRAHAGRLELDEAHAREHALRAQVHDLDETLASYRRRKIIRMLDHRLLRRGRGSEPQQHSP